MHRYVRDNAGLAWKAVSAIERGDARELGRAMAAAQVRARGHAYGVESGVGRRSRAHRSFEAAGICLEDLPSCL